MEYKNLTTFVMAIVLIGMLVGVGVLTLDKFSTATRVSTVISNESFTMPTENGTVALAHGNITKFTRIDNASGTTGTWNTSHYNTTLATGLIGFTAANDSAQQCRESQTCYAYYTYDEYDGAPKTTLDASRTAVGDISNVWLALIVTIAILAIIIGLVMQGFGGSGKR